MFQRKATPYDHLIYTEEWRAWNDPDVPARFNPVNVLLGKAQGDRLALLADGIPVTYDELRDRISRTASALASVGVAAGERVLFFGTDSIDYISAWLGAIYIGAIPAVVSDLYKTPELGYFLDDTGATTLLIDAEQFGKLNEIANHLPPSLQRIVIRGRATLEHAGEVGRPTHLLADLLDAAQPIADSHLWHSDDVCYMFYSGGTTGTAKGITHLAYDFILVPARQGAFWNYVEDDVVYASSRKYFTHGLWPGVLIPLAHGATAVIDRRGPAPEIVFELIEAHKVTKFITVPTVIKNMIDAGSGAPIRPNLSSVRLVISASEKIPPEVFGSFESIFGLEILDSIGSSEITYEWIANRLSEAKRGSLGKPVFGYEVRLIGPDGEDVVIPNVPGEAWIKSRTACFFYWRKYERSRDTFIGPWTRTGDSLMFDEDGFFWFNSRESDVFKVKGLWVSPIEIESAITSHPFVREAAVVSLQDARGLTKVQAFVVLRKAACPDDALRADLRDRVKPLGGYKVSERITFVESLPRTTLLKIDRKVLRDR